MKHLARRSIRMCKNRNILIVFSIMISVTMIMTLLLTGLEVKQSIINQGKKLYQATFNNISERKAYKIKENSKVNKLGLMFQMGDINIDDYTLNIFYCDETMLKKICNNAKINLPQNIDDIIISKGLLNHVNSNSDSSIKLDLGYGLKEYKVKEIINNKSERLKTYNVYISREFLKTKLGEIPDKYIGYIWLNDIQHSSEINIKRKIDFLAQKYEISPQQLNLNSSYFTLVKNKMTLSQIILYSLIIIIILCGAGLVIYSIYSIFISDKIKEYGKLKTIGATSKQIESMIKYEGKILAIYGIIPGILMGGIISYCIHPDGWNWLNTVVVGILASFFGVIVILFSIRQPSKIAANISPIQAMHYLESNENTVLRKNIKKRYRITTLRLAILNLKRKRKSSLLTIVSLGFCGVLLMCAASFQSSYSVKGMVKETEMRYGDFILEFTGNSIVNNVDIKNFGIAPLQENNNVLNDTLKDKVLSIDGVKKIKVWEGTSINFSVKNTKINQEINPIWGFGETDVEKLSNVLVEGYIDYEQLIKNDGIIINNGNVLQEVYGWKPKIGQKIELSFWQSDGIPVDKTFTVIGITNKRDGFKNFLRIPVEKLNNITKYNCDRKWEIIIDESKSSLIKKQLETLIRDMGNIKMISFNDKIIELKEASNVGFFVIYIIVVFIGIFGVITLVNSRVTNIVALEQEIRMLKAVGMTKKQLGEIFLKEGCIYILGAILITIVFGTPLGYLVCRVAEKIGVVINYKFPTQSLILFISGLFLMQLLLSVILIKKANGESFNKTL